MIKRYRPMAALALTTALGVTLSVIPATASPASGKVSVPVFQIASLGAPNPVVAALMPRGPQRLSIVMTLGADRETVSGYIDFTGGTESGCSFDLVGRMDDGGHIQTTVMIRDPEGLAFGKQTVGAAGAGIPKAAQGRFVPIGGPWGYIYIPMSWTPGSTFLFDNSAIGPKQASMWCRFADLPYYTTLKPGTSALIVNGRRLTAIGDATIKYYDALLINALDLPTRADAQTKLKYLEGLAAPLFGNLANEISWTLTKRDNVVTLKYYGSPQTTKSTPTSVLTLTPTSLQTVPSVAGPTPGALKVASLCGPTKAWKNLQTLATLSCNK